MLSNIKIGLLGLFCLFISGKVKTKICPDEKMSSFQFVTSLSHCVF